MDQVVQFVKTQYETCTSFSPSSFQLRMDRKHVWLQRIAIWILRKLDCFAIQKETFIVKQTVNTQDFVKALWEQQNELFATYHYRGSRLLVGHEEFQKLHGFPINHPLSISMQYMWSESGRDLKDPFAMVRTANVLEITVIPWMRGMLVLPKDFHHN